MDKMRETHPRRHGPVWLVAAVAAGLCLGGTLPLAGAPRSTGKKKPVEKDPQEEAARAFEKALAERYQGVDRGELNKILAEPGVVGTAARILRDQREAQIRQAALRYLGTLDVQTWPEVEAALISGLRTDRNEAVRWTAALVLSRGNCCTKRVAAALQISVDGGQQDGNAAETSDRVRKAARIALDVCLKKLKGPNTRND